MLTVWDNISASMKPSGQRTLGEIERQWHIVVDYADDLMIILRGPFFFDTLMET